MTSRALKWGIAAAALLASPGARADDANDADDAPSPAAPTDAPRVFGPLELAPYVTTMTAELVPAPQEAASVTLLGAGVRLGASFHDVYAGLQFTQLLNTSAACPAFGCVQQQAFFYGLETAYPLVSTPLLLIRPRLGVGDFVVNRQSTEILMECFDPGDCLPEGSSSLHALYLAPGILFAVTPSVLLVGLDVGALFIPSFPAWNASRSSSTEASGTVRFEFGLRL